MLTRTGSRPSRKTKLGRMLLPGKPHFIWEALDVRASRFPIREASRPR